MPLLNKRPFVKNEPPTNLGPKDEVFYCDVTNEVFTDYDEYWERLVLCNAMVWTCGLTGRPNLTYTEAMECEAKARKCLSNLPTPLCKPILHLATMTKRGRLVDMADDVFFYARDRYFIGEEVEAIIGKHWYDCKVTKLIYPTKEEIEKYEEEMADTDEEDEEEKKDNDTEKKDDDSDIVEIKEVKKEEKDVKMEDDDIQIIEPEKKDEKKKKEKEKEKEKKKPEDDYPPFATFKYEVVEIDPINDNDKDKPHLVSWEKIRRNKGVLTREKCKLYLKQAVELAQTGYWSIKEAATKKYNLGETKFTDYFIGDPPKFVESKAKKIPGPSPLSPKGKKKEEKRLEKEKKREEKRKKKEERAENEKQLKKEGKGRPALSLEEKEARKKLIMDAKLDLKEQMEKKREEWRLKIEKDKMDKKRERELKKEEKRIMHLFMKEWQKPKEDQDCEDHKDLPTPTPIQCRIPHQNFGEFMMILEFTNIFTELLELNDVYPQGITFDMLEHALVEKEVAGVLNDIFQLYLQTIFCLQEEEDDEVEAENEVDEEMESDTKDLTKVAAVKLANRAATWSKQYQGVPLQKAPLDALTLTEILRLHLLSSGATNVANEKWRHANRGGFKNWDDPGLLFKLEEPDTIKALATQTVFDLTIEQKLKVLNVLVGQILTYASVRDILEENIEKLKEAKNQIRQHKMEGLRKEKEEEAARVQEKREKKQKEREKLLKELEKRAAEAAAAGGPVVNGDIAKEKEEPEEEEMEEEEDEEEKAERLEKEEKNKERKRGEFVKRETELIKQMFEMASGVSIYSLGQDRAYRRYWIFGNMPGLFIEDNEPNPGICRSTPTPYNPNLNPSESAELLQQIRMQAELCVRKQELREKEFKERQLKEKEKEKESNSDKENDSNDSPNKQAMAKTPLGEKKLLQSVNQNQSNSDQAKKEITEQKIESAAESEFKLDFSILENLKSEVTEPCPEIYGLCNANAQTCTVHSQSDKKHWSFIHKLEDFDTLVNSLNPRGIRESELREALVTYRGHIESSLKDCHVFKLDSSQEPEVDTNIRKSTRKETKKEDANLNFPSGTPMNEILQLTLRDMILETEEKLELGMLGSLKTENREDWRQTIVDGKYESGVEEWNWGGRKRLNELKEEYGLEEEEEEGMDESENTDQLVKDLSHAILQLGQALDSKYLQKPLAENEKDVKKREKSERKLKRWIEKKNKKDDDEEEEEEEEVVEEEEEDDEDEDEEEDEEARISDNALRTPMERWEKSLMECTNLSQLCLHFSTLENSITWSRSALEARCRVCKRKSDPDNMLLCDSCDKGTHLYCLKPKLKKVPEGEWFCDQCQPKRKPRSPVKKARRATYVEESEDDDDEDSDEEEESEEEEEEEDDATCEVCDETGEVICCDTCPRVYHQDCAELRKVPRGSWSCPQCRLDPKAAKDKENAKTKKNKGKGKGKENTKAKKVAKKDNKRKSRGGDETPTAAKKLKMEDAAVEVSPPRRNRRSLVDEDMILNTGALEALLGELYKQEDSWPFLAPVSRKAAPDYYEIIKKPMDLGTMRHKLDSFKYTSDEEFIADGMIVFQNCQQYNQENTDEYKCGTRMIKFYLKTIKELGLRQNQKKRSRK